MWQWSGTQAMIFAAPELDWKCVEGSSVCKGPQTSKNNFQHRKIRMEICSRRKNKDCHSWFWSFLWIVMAHLYDKLGFLFWPTCWDICYGVDGWCLWTKTCSISCICLCYLCPVAWSFGAKHLVIFSFPILDVDSLLLAFSITFLYCYQNLCPHDTERWQTI